MVVTASVDADTGALTLGTDSGTATLETTAGTATIGEDVVVTASVDADTGALTLGTDSGTATLETTAGTATIAEHVEVTVSDDTTEGGKFAFSVSEVGDAADGASVTLENEVTGSSMTFEIGSSMDASIEGGNLTITDFSGEGHITNEDGSTGTIETGFSLGTLSTVDETGASGKPLSSPIESTDSNTDSETDSDNDQDADPDSDTDTDANPDDSDPFVTDSDADSANDPDADPDADTDPDVNPDDSGIDDSNPVVTGTDTDPITDADTDAVAEKVFDTIAEGEAPAALGEPSAETGDSGGSGTGNTVTDGGGDAIFSGGDTPAGSGAGQGVSGAVGSASVVNSTGNNITQFAQSSFFSDESGKNDDPVGPVDADGDGVDAAIDPDDNNANVTGVDNDGDGVDGAVDPDDWNVNVTGVDNDGDGVDVAVDSDDNDAYVTGVDIDGDGVDAAVDSDDWNANVSGVDDDGDGIDGAIDPDDNNANVTGVDIDGDGIDAAVDSDDWNANVSGVDADGDGVDAAIDPDDNNTNVTGVDNDGDGVDAAVDSDDWNVNVSGVDGDGDGVDAAVDPDDNDAYVTGVDNDGDGVDGAVDPDDWNVNVSGVDGDGDGVDAAVDPDDNDAYVTGVDNDGDGVDAAVDPDDWNPNITPDDLDGDGIVNNADTDDDGDGVLDVSDAFPLDSGESLDTDFDGIGNNADPDDDGDGAHDLNDPFPGDPNTPVFYEGFSNGLDSWDFKINSYTSNSFGSNIGPANSYDDKFAVVRSFAGVEGKLARRFNYSVGGNRNITFDYNFVTTSPPGSVMDFDSGVNWGNHEGYVLAGFGGPYSNSNYNTYYSNTVDYPSGEWALYGSYIASLSHISGGLFNFDGAYFTTWSDNDDNAYYSSDTITLEGYKDGTKIYDTTYSLTNDFVWYDAEFSGVDQVRFLSSENDKWWLTDNVTFFSDYDKVIVQLHISDGSIVEIPLSISNLSAVNDLPTGVLSGSSGFQTGWLSIDWMDYVPEGETILEFKIIDDGDGVSESALLVDNVVDIGDDSDGDGVLDVTDVFPNDSSESLDSDGDGTGDNADLDDDNDGVVDASDAFPLDSAETVDTDGDGTGNNADTDDDGDGVVDISDVFPLDSTETVDTDGDLIGNNADTDDDGDLALDINDPFPLNSTVPLFHEDFSHTAGFDNKGWVRDNDGQGNSYNPNNAYIDTSFGPDIGPKTGDDDKFAIIHTGNDSAGGDGFLGKQFNFTESGTRTLSFDYNFVTTVTPPTVLTFDDLDTWSFLNYNTNTYGGLQWQTVRIYDAATNSAYEGTGIENGTVSGTNVAYDYYASSNIEVYHPSSTGTFDFAGTYVSAISKDGMQVTFKGYKDSLLQTQYNTTVSVDHTGPNWVQLDFKDIDRLVISKSGGTQVSGLQNFVNRIVMDNFTLGDPGLGGNDAFTAELVLSDGSVVELAYEDVMRTATTPVSNLPTTVLNVSEGFQTGWLSAEWTGHVPSGTTYLQFKLKDADELLNASAVLLDNITDIDDDNDGDGVLNVSDAFPLDPNETLDADGDGTGDNADTDDDNDGMLDAFEIANGLNPLFDDSNLDLDNDGVVNLQDAFPNNWYESVDTDGDLIGNNADTDDDGDGMLDAFEIAHGLNPLVDDSNEDPDGDGVANLQDAFPVDPDETMDTDGDEIGNNADTDDDNDGVLDVADALPLNENESVDTDGDLIGNNADTDDDGDLALDINDPFPLNSTVPLFHEAFSHTGGFDHQGWVRDDDGKGNSYNPNNAYIDTSFGSVAPKTGLDGEFAVIHTGDTDDVVIFGFGGGTSAGSDGYLGKEFNFTESGTRTIKFDYNFLTTASEKTVLTFDDAPLTNINNEIFNGYKGTTWSYETVTDTTQVTTQGTGYHNGLVSGTKVLASSSQYGSPVYVYRDGSNIDILGTYVSAAFRDGMQVTFDAYSGYSSSSLIASKTVTVDHTGPNWVQLDFKNVFRMLISRSGGTHVVGNNYSWDEGRIVMDDFTLGLAGGNDAFTAELHLSDGSVVQLANEDVYTASLTPVTGLPTDVLNISEGFQTGWLSAEWTGYVPSGTTYLHFKLKDADELLNASAVLLDNITDIDDDDDNDGVLNVSDVFPNDSTETLDNDGDGTGDNADTDDDNDGVADASDAFPFDSTETSDNDGDGTGDNADTDDDNDGIGDNSEIAGGTNPLLADSDSDGVSDLSDVFPNDPFETEDTDGDGLGNNADPTPFVSDNFSDNFTNGSLASKGWYETNASIASSFGSIGPKTPADGNFAIIHTYGTGYNYSNYNGYLTHEITITEAGYRRISFDYNFITTEDPSNNYYNDTFQAFLYLSGEASNVQLVYEDVDNSSFTPVTGLPTSLIGNTDGYQTGWKSIVASAYIPLLTDWGMGEEEIEAWIEFRVSESYGGRYTNASAALIDNVVDPLIEASSTDYMLTFAKMLRGDIDIHDADLEADAVASEEHQAFIAKVNEVINDIENSSVSEFMDGKDEFFDRLWVARDTLADHEESTEFLQQTGVAHHLLEASIMTDGGVGTHNIAAIHDSLKQAKTFLAAHINDFGETDALANIRTQIDSVLANVENMNNNEYTTATMVAIRNGLKKAFSDTIDHMSGDGHECINGNHLECKQSS